MTSMAETVQRLRQHQPPSSYNLAPIYIHLSQKKLTVLGIWSLKMEKKKSRKACISDPQRHLHYL